MSSSYNGYTFGIDQGNGEMSSTIFNPFGVSRVLQSSILASNDSYLSGSASMLAKRMVDERFDYTTDMTIPFHDFKISFHT
eukprot:gene42952-57122_t